MNRSTLYACFFVCSQLVCALQLIGQTNGLQSFTIAAGSVFTNHPLAYQFDWRLDLGATHILLNHANEYHFTAGFIQPNIDRYNTIEDWKNAGPALQVRYINQGHSIMLSSKANDFIVYGYCIYTAHGQVLLRSVLKIASSFLQIAIQLPSLPEGAYFIQIYFLPESINENKVNGYWTSTLKFLKK